MKKNIYKRGFTLIEILVVIGIIGLLAALLVVGVGNLKEKSKEAKTRGILKKCTQGLEKYKTEFGVYPPSSSPYISSQALHYFLGGYISKNEYQGGVIVTREVGPMVEFIDNEVEGGNANNTNPPRYLIDAWRNRIDYQNPSLTAGQPYTLRSMGAPIRGGYRFGDGNDLEGEM